MAATPSVRQQELAAWDNSTHFCAACGTGLVPAPPAFAKRCPHCGRDYFPQITPAIIVLVHRGEDILLVHAKNFTGPHYALIAGFVEAGETLEEAVRREIHEEVAVEVRDIRYVLSAPWPHPANIMVGFMAEYVSGEIVLQEEELTAGGWFNIHSLPLLPPTTGVARGLIAQYKNNFTAQR